MKHKGKTRLNSQNIKEDNMKQKMQYQTEKGKKRLKN